VTKKKRTGKQAAGRVEEEGGAGEKAIIFSFLHEGRQGGRFEVFDVGEGGGPASGFKQKKLPSRRQRRRVQEGLNANRKKLQNEDKEKKNTQVPCRGRLPGRGKMPRPNELPPLHFPGKE